MLPGWRESYLSKDETGGRGAAIGPLKSTPPGIGSTIHLFRETLTVETAGNLQLAEDVFSGCSRKGKTLE